MRESKSLVIIIVVAVITICIRPFYRDTICSWASQRKESLGWDCRIHHLGGQPTVKSVMLLGVVDILFFCMPHLLTSATMVDHVSWWWYHTARDGSLGTIKSSEGKEEETMRKNVVFSNVVPITWQHHTMCWRRFMWEGGAQSIAH